VGEPASSGLQLGKVGGLYLDYAAIAYYDGAVLFAGTLLIVFAGTPSTPVAQSQLAWIFFSLGLTIGSWLLAPFVFNPYQFQARAFRQDLRAVLAFFLEGGGKHWVEWYDRTQLRKGSGRSAVDITFFLAAFAAMAWYAMMNVKVEAFGRIFAVTTVTVNLMMLIPPVLLSLVFCVLISILTLCRGTMLGKAGPSKAHVREKDRTVADGGAPVGAAADKRRSCTCCCSGVPLLLIALSVLVLDVAEATLGVWRFYQIGWSRAFVGGLVLKWCMVCLLLHIAEGSVRSRFFPALRCLGAPLDLWLHAHRMARDVLTSWLILAALTPVVLLNMLNDCLCPGLSLHHLLIYRNPNHLARQEA